MVNVTPYTGSEYLESLRDGRQIFLHGEPVKDVTTHPAFANNARMTARLYDALHDPETGSRLTVPCDVEGGSFTHPFFRTPRSVDDLLQDKDAIEGWARMTYGWMGRSPDYKASFLGTLGANAPYYAPFEENAKRWYAKSQTRVDFWNHAIIHPPVDRSLPPEQIEDVFVHVERETDAGLVVSGAKVVATGSATTHFNFISHYGLPIKDKKFAIVAALPMGTPGMKLLCRTSYSQNSVMAGSPFDYPLSSRLDENDTVFILDRVLIPWENVFIYGDVDKVNEYAPKSGFMDRLTFHGCIRLAVKLEFLAGLLTKALKASGTLDFRGVQMRVGEVLAWRSMFWALVEAQARNPVEWVNGAVIPRLEYGMCYRWFMTVGYPRIKEIILQDVASGLIYMPSGADDLTSDVTRPYIDKYLRGSGGMVAYDRVKLMKLLWDAIGTEFGGRHELYERNYSGNHEAVRLDIYNVQQGLGALSRYEGFVEDYMSEYDHEGWRAEDMLNFPAIRDRTPGVR